MDTVDTIKLIRELATQGHFRGIDEIAKKGDEIVFRVRVDNSEITGLKELHSAVTLELHKHRIPFMTTGMKYHWVDPIAAPYKSLAKSAHYWLSIR